jgi:DNA uptake protein ComE-like DNA-binding protein
MAVAVCLSPLPCVAQTAAQRHDARKAEQASRAQVDINRASLEELLTVPGMTRTWAQRIVRFRPYRTKQDLLDEGVIPGRLYARLRDYLIAHRQ